MLKLDGLNEKVLESYVFPRRPANTMLVMKEGGILEERIKKGTYASTRLQEKGRGGCILPAARVGMFGWR